MSKKATLCYCIKGDEVLLGMKKKGFGSGKPNGSGGKVKKGELPINAAVRELKEEFNMDAQEKDLKQVAFINFSFEGDLAFECYVFITRCWEGEPGETEEMCPKWYPISNLPFHQMWTGDKEWMPLIFDNKTIEASVDFDSTGTIVNKFEYKFAQFS